MTLNDIIDYMGLNYDNWSEEMKLDAIINRFKQYETMLEETKSQSIKNYRLAHYYARNLARTGHETYIPPEKLEEIWAGEDERS